MCLCGFKRNFDANLEERMRTTKDYFIDHHEIGHNCQGGWTIEGLGEVSDASSQNFLFKF